MNYYAGIDVSLEESCICVIDANGKVVREGKVCPGLDDVYRDWGHGPRNSRAWPPPSRMRTPNAVTVKVTAVASSLWAA
jgi:hypothetical protein